MRINNGTSLEFIGLPNGPPSYPGRLTPAKLRERCELVFQLVPEKIKNLVIVNSSLSNFEMIHACVEVADKYAENVMVIPPLLGLLTYALESLSKFRNPPLEEVIMVVSHTPEFVDFIILQRDRNDKLNITKYAHFNDQRQCEEIFPKFYDKYFPHSTIFIVHDSLRSVAENIRHQSQPENCFIKSFAKWDYVLLSGGTYRAMDEEGFDPSYHITNFSSGYETIIYNRRTGRDERYVLLPERSPLPCNIYGFNGIPQQIKLFYFTEYYHKGESLVTSKRDATKYTFPVSGSAEEIIGYVDERGVPYAPPLSRDTVDVGRREQDTVESRKAEPSEVFQPRNQGIINQYPEHHRTAYQDTVHVRKREQETVESRRVGTSEKFHPQNHNNITNHENHRMPYQNTVESRRTRPTEMLQPQKHDVIVGRSAKNHQTTNQILADSGINSALSSRVSKQMLPQTSSSIASAATPADSSRIKFIFRDDNFFAIHITQNGVTKVVTDSFGNEWCPLYLSLTENGVEIGEKARRYSKTFPQQVIYDVLKIIGKPFNEIQINPKWGFELINKNGIVYFQVKTSTGLFSQELIISAFLKAMKLQTESFMGTQNHIKEIRLSTNFRLSQSQKDIFKKAAAKNNLEILLFNVSDM
uniref:Uncharacterized protein n=1 Tax=Panagrolaimus sp. ES5 TaxID=591445 RepID=A0AC34FC93_9BILA